jgi:hypothetical protein
MASPSLSRCCSDASANTSASSHRRGGTVYEFSFEATPGNRGVHIVPQLPTFPRGRCNSLPLEVHIQHRPPPAPRQRAYSQTNKRTTYYQHTDDDDSSWNQECEERCEDVSAYESMPSFSEQEDGPEGYVSPLEEEREQEVKPSLRTSNASLHSNPQDSNLVAPDSPPTRTKVAGSVPFEATSPFAKLKEPPAIPAGDSWMWQWVNNEGSGNNDAMSEVQEDQATTISAPVAARISIDEADYAKSPLRQQNQKLEYMPKNTIMEDQWKALHGSSEASFFSLSGWVAFDWGSTLLDSLRADDSEDYVLSQSNVAYLMTAPDGSPTLWVTSSPLTTPNKFQSVDLVGCQVQIEEISRRHGRAVVVQRVRNGVTEVVCTILPICLPESYNGSTAEETGFSLDRCFPSKGDYLPDEQQYTVMHVMFSLDALVKANSSLVSMSWNY